MCAYIMGGLADDSGEVVEAYGYDAYGAVRMFRVEGHVADADRDGDVDMSDFECLQRCFSGNGIGTGTQLIFGGPCWTRAGHH